jgi:pyruvate kinase
LVVVRIVLHNTFVVGPIIMKFLAIVSALATVATAFVPAARTFQQAPSSTSSSPTSLFQSTSTQDAYGRTVTTSTLPTTVATAPSVAQRWRKSTKQVATLGPASSSKEMIEKLFLAGADVFRLNFSHGSQEQKKELLDMIRSVEEKYSHPIAILGDLQGPKLRVSRIFCV